MKITTNYAYNQSKVDNSKKNKSNSNNLSFGTLNVEGFTKEFLTKPNRSNMLQYFSKDKGIAESLNKVINSVKNVASKVQQDGVSECKLECLQVVTPPHVLTNIKLNKSYDELLKKLGINDYVATCNDFQGEHNQIAEKSEEMISNAYNLAVEKTKKLDEIRVLLDKNPLIKEQLDTDPELLSAFPDNDNGRIDCIHNFLSGFNNAMVEISKNPVDGIKFAPIKISKDSKSVRQFELGDNGAFSYDIYKVTAKCEPEEKSLQDVAKKAGIESFTEAVSEEYNKYNHFDKTTLEKNIKRMTYDAIKKAYSGQKVLNENLRGIAPLLPAEKVITVAKPSFMQKMKDLLFLKKSINLLND